jgi:hypothetical protein
MKKQKGSFIIHVDSLVVLDALTDAQAGQLLRVMRDYHSGNEIECDPIVRVAFMSFQAQFERDAVKYGVKCDRNATNGAKGGRPKKEPTETQKTQSVILKPKKADSDSDSDSDNDSDSDSGTSLVVINNNKSIEKKRTELAIRDDYQNFIELMQTLTGKLYRGDKKSRSQFNARLKDGYTVEEITRAATNAAKAENHKKNNFFYLTPELITRQDKLEMYCTALPTNTVEPSRKINRNQTIGDVDQIKKQFAELKNQNQL